MCFQKESVRTLWSMTVNVKLYLRLTSSLYKPASPAGRHWTACQSSSRVITIQIHSSYNSQSSLWQLAGKDDEPQHALVDWMKARTRKWEFQLRKSNVCGCCNASRSISWHCGRRIWPLCLFCDKKSSLYNWWSLWEADWKPIFWESFSEIKLSPCVSENVANVTPTCDCWTRYYKNTLMCCLRSPVESFHQVLEHGCRDLLP